MYFLCVLLLNSFDMQTTIPFVFCSFDFVIFWAKGCMLCMDPVLDHFFLLLSFLGHSPAQVPAEEGGEQGHRLRLGPSQWEQSATGNLPLGCRSAGFTR